jgi:CheY-like chemotaxis protein
MTGSQSAGDAAVKACLEWLLADVGRFDSNEARSSLYRALHAAWTQAGIGHAGDGTVEGAQIVASRIGQLPEARRRLLLLTTLEGFSISQAAAIMEMDQATAQMELAAAKQEMRAQPSTRVLIIEDEPVIALDIATTVQASGHDVVGIASTRSEAVELARTERPGLILADIQLADNSSGIDAVRDILTYFNVPVIFITAFPERLLTGERLEPTFLITKPFDPETLSVSISQALATAASAIHA